MAHNIWDKQAAAFWRRQDAKAAMFDELVRVCELTLKAFAVLRPNIIEEGQAEYLDLYNFVETVLAKAKEIQNVSNPTP